MAKKRSKSRICVKSSKWQRMILLIYSIISGLGTLMVIALGTNLLVENETYVLLIWCSILALFWSKMILSKSQIPHRKLLSFHANLLGQIFFTSILFFCNYKEYKAEVRDNLKEAMQLYNENKTAETFWDKLQKSKECCGVSDSRNWEDFLSDVKVPASCCKQGLSCEMSPTPQNSYTKGCLYEYIAVLGSNMGMMIAILKSCFTFALFVAVFHFLITAIDIDSNILNIFVKNLII